MRQLSVIVSSLLHNVKKMVLMNLPWSRSILQMLHLSGPVSQAGMLN